MTTTAFFPAINNANLDVAVRTKSRKIPLLRGEGFCNRLLISEYLRKQALEVPYLRSATGSTQMSIQAAWQFPLTELRSL